jgi:hypothetical protein
MSPLTGYVHTGLHRRTKIPELPDREAGAIEQLQRTVTDLERAYDVHEANLRANARRGSTHRAVTRSGERLGHALADVQMLLLNPGGRSRKIFDGLAEGRRGGQGEFDQIWVNTSRSGHEDFFVVECKASPSGALGYIEHGGVRYSQGTPEYFHLTLNVMSQRGGKSQVLAGQLRAASAAGNLMYLQVSPYRKLDAYVRDDGSMRRFPDPGPRRD